MPSFWTADTPVGHLKVRIRSGKHSHDQERRLVVPASAYTALRELLQRRQQLTVVRDSIFNAAGDDELYVSISTRNNRQRPFIVQIFKDDSGTHDDQSEDGNSDLVCTVCDKVWKEISGGRHKFYDSDASIRVLLEPVLPIELSEIVLGVSSEQYVAAQSMQTEIASQLTAHSDVFYPGRILSITFGGESELDTLITLKCLMCQPTFCGVISRERLPRIIIAKDTAQESAASRQSSTDIDPEYDTEADMDFDQWDLGAEWFILGSTPLGEDREKLANAAFNDPQLVKLLEQSNIPEDRAESILPETRSSRCIEFTATMIATPPNDDEIAPRVCSGEDPDNCGFMSLTSLARTGIVSGSWVLVATRGNGEDSSHTRQRAIRVYGWDIGASNKASLVLPPVLFYNLQLKSASFPAGFALYPPVDFQVYITPLGFPPSISSSAYLKNVEKRADNIYPLTQPALPMARKVVIARISSPLSERRDIETISLAALRKWLQPKVSQSDSTKPLLRVVKAGDIIAVRVHLADAAIRTGVALAAGADTAIRVRNGDSTIDPSSIDVDPVVDIALNCSVDLGANAYAAITNELVFYRVERAEGFYNRAHHGSQQIVPDSNDDSHSEDSDCSDSESDFDSGEDIGSYNYADSTGELSQSDREWDLWYCQVRNKGLVVVPDITMVIQASSVHSTVPYRSISAYMTTVDDSLCASREKDTTPVEASATPYADILKQLLRLTKTSLHPLALARNLVCAILLKGNPGTGKRHMVHEIAEQLGLHLYELSCFDILSDTEDKTAQVLQMYFQNARRYAPCIFHLRSIEALGQASNTQPGQDVPDDLPIARVLKSCIAGVCQAHRDTGFPVIVVATSSYPEMIPTSLASAFRHEIELPVPDELTRLALLGQITNGRIPLAADTDMPYIAQQTASFVARDLATLIKRAERHAWKRAQMHLHPATDIGAISNTSTQQLRTRDIILSGHTITNEDLLCALRDARASISDTLGVPKIPNVKWDDVGGLADAKKDILDTIRLPMEQPHLFASGLTTRSGLLFYGPPGTGKTLLAKAIATECGLNFFSCKGPELISPYIGESEANVRRIFQKAREASPCVIFFDELDSLAPKRGQQGDSGGVMDRIVSQLLAELDGMSGSSSSKTQDADTQSTEQGNEASKDSGAGAAQVFAIGATNRPDLLDPALLRPGRFDKLVYLGVSETHEAQLNIIQALTRKFNLHPDLDLQSIAEKCPFNYTGADFYALCSDALLKAMLRTVDEVDVLVAEWNDNKKHIPDTTTKQGDPACLKIDDRKEHYPVPMSAQYYLDHIAPDNVKQVTVTAGDFQKALDELIPSVSSGELVRYQTLRRQFDSAQRGKGKEKTSGYPDNNSKVPTIQQPDDVLDIRKVEKAQQEFDQASNANNAGAASQNRITKSESKRKGKGKEPEI
ncbi:peroxisomal assembly protein [Coemansia sp. RSA 1365]|nr:peroxisomal assembly protein [Coemansia sp. RSA 1365]